MARTGRLNQQEHDEHMVLVSTCNVLSQSARRRLWALDNRALLYGSDGISARGFLGLEARFVRSMPVANTKLTAAAEEWLQKADSHYAAIYEDMARGLGIWRTTVEGNEVRTEHIASADFFNPPRDSTPD